MPLFIFLPRRVESRCMTRGQKKCLTCFLWILVGFDRENESAMSALHRFACSNASNASMALSYSTDRCSIPDSPLSSRSLLLFPLSPLLPFGTEHRVLSSSLIGLSSPPSPSFLPSFHMKGQEFGNKLQRAIPSVQSFMVPL